MVFVNEELNDYVVNASGISRTGLNTMAFIGLFVFGWLIAIVFDKLGKSGIGWFYLITILIIMAVSRHNPDPGLFTLGIAIYISAWLHASKILKDYEGTAKSRIEEIDQEPEIKPDMLLEKGMLQNKVLREEQVGLDTLTNALQLSGGNPHLLNYAGVAMSDNERYEDARAFFDRAMTSTEDEVLIEQLKENLEFIEKKEK